MAVTLALVDGARTVSIDPPFACSPWRAGRCAKGICEVDRSHPAQVGVAFADAAGRRLGACEFADDEHFCNLEAVTMQLGAKECVIPKVRCCQDPPQGKLERGFGPEAATSLARASNGFAARYCAATAGVRLWLDRSQLRGSTDTHSAPVAAAFEACCLLGQEAAASGTAGDWRRLRDVLGRCEALATERDKSSFSGKNVEQDLGRLLRDGNVEHNRDVLDRPLAKAALAGACPSYLRSLLTRCLSYTE